MEFPLFEAALVIIGVCGLAWLLRVVGAKFGSHPTPGRPSDGVDPAVAKRLPWLESDEEVDADADEERRLRRKKMG